MSDAISTIGAAGVATVGTLAVTGAALKAVGKVTKGMGKSPSRKGSGRRGKSKSFSVWD